MRRASKEVTPVLQVAQCYRARGRKAERGQCHALDARGKGGIDNNSPVSQLSEFKTTKDRNG